MCHKSTVVCIQLSIMSKILQKNMFLKRNISTSKSNLYSTRSVAIALLKSSNWSAIYPKCYVKWKQASSRVWTCVTECIFYVKWKQHRPGFELVTPSVFSMWNENSIVQGLNLCHRVYFLCEMKTASFLIWTCITEFISYVNNNYATMSVIYKFIFSELKKRTPCFDIFLFLFDVICFGWDNPCR